MGGFWRVGCQDDPDRAGENHVPARLRTESGQAVGPQGRGVLPFVPLESVTRGEDVLGYDPLHCAASPVGVEQHDDARLGPALDDLLNVAIPEPIHVLTQGG